VSDEPEGEKSGSSTGKTLLGETVYASLSDIPRQGRHSGGRIVKAETEAGTHKVPTSNNRLRHELTKGQFRKICHDI